MGRALSSLFLLLLLTVYSQLNRWRDRPADRPAKGSYFEWIEAEQRKARKDNLFFLYCWNTVAHIFFVDSLSERVVCVSSLTGTGTGRTTAGPGPGQEMKNTFMSSSVGCLNTWIEMTVFCCHTKRQRRRRTKRHSTTASYSSFSSFHK